MTDIFLFVIAVLLFCVLYGISEINFWLKALNERSKTVDTRLRNVEMELLPSIEKKAGELASCVLHQGRYGNSRIGVDTTNYSR